MTHIEDQEQAHEVGWGRREAPQNTTTACKRLEMSGLSIS